MTIHCRWTYAISALLELNRESSCPTRGRRSAGSSPSKTRKMVTAEIALLAPSLQYPTTCSDVPALGMAPGPALRPNQFFRCDWVYEARRAWCCRQPSSCGLRSSEAVVLDRTRKGRGPPRCGWSGRRWPRSTTMSRWHRSGVFLELAYPGGLLFTR